MIAGSPGVAPSAPPVTVTRPRLAVVVSFLNEASYLPRLLASLAGQTEPPDEVILVDDGSTDGSPALAAEFAGRHGYARVVMRPRQHEVKDRLAGAPELRAFEWGVANLLRPWDIVAKLDGDVELSPTVFEDVRQAFLDDPALGTTGSYLSIIGADGRPVRERNAPYHVRGPNKFYRRACYELITPLPHQLGWDAIDDLRARRLGWKTRSFTPRAGDSLHLRPTGAYDGRLRAFRRWGRCAWAYGAHPLWVLAAAIHITARRPYVLTGLNYLVGWGAAALSRYPRAEPELVAFCRREDIARIRGLLRSVAAR